VEIKEGAKCPECGTLVNEKFIAVCEIIRSNAVMGLDQHRAYATIEDAFENYYENVADSIDEIPGLMDYYNNTFHRNARPMFIAYFAREADRQGVKVPDKLLGIEYQREVRW
jgi:hypothetical protein